MRGYLPRLFLLAALWGSSYLFIKVGVDDLEPSVLMVGRTLLAGILLLTFVVATRGPSRVRAELAAMKRQSIVYGTVNAALPFWLIAWGETHIDSSVAGIAQATVPLFAFLIGLRLLPHEPVARIRWVGVALGLAGVAALSGLDTSGGWFAAVGTFAIVLSSLSYGFAGVYAQVHVPPAAGPIVATGGMLFAAVLLLPVAVVQRPDAVPGWQALASVAALAIIGTAIAQIVFFHMLPLYGARRISLVAYLMPAFAIVYGAVFLSEPVTVAMLAGLGLILLGVALGSGLVLSSARRAKPLEDPV